MNFLKAALVVVVLGCLIGLRFNVAASMEEAKDIRIFIDAVEVKFSDPIIIQNGRTMLPIREMLISLGVPNDEEHIFWDNERRVARIKKGDVTIELKNGDSNAMKNGIPHILDSAPFIYSKNNRMYIPLRFVSENLEMKAAWSDKNRTVLIREMGEFNRIKSKITEVNNNMKSFDKVSYTKELNYTEDIEEIMIKSEVKVDYDKKEIVTKVNTNENGETFGIDSMRYISDKYFYYPIGSGGYRKQPLSSGESEEIFAKKRDALLPEEDWFICGLIAEGDKKGIYKLRGKGWEIEDLPKKMGTNESSIKYLDGNIEVSFTGVGGKLLEWVKVTFNAEVKNGDGIANDILSGSVSKNYTGVGTGIEASIPSSVKDGARLSEDDEKWW